MKLKLDENIPISIAEVLTPLGHDVHTVTGEGLIGRADQEIWTHCQLEDRLLITQDLDFSDSLNHSERWLRSGRPDILEVAMARYQSGEPSLRVGGCGDGTLLGFKS